MLVWTISQLSGTYWQEYMSLENRFFDLQTKVVLAVLGPVFIITVITNKHFAKNNKILMNLITKHANKIILYLYTWCCFGLGIFWGSVDWFCLSSVTLITNVSIVIAEISKQNGCDQPLSRKLQVILGMFMTKIQVNHQTKNSVVQNFDVAFANKLIF